MIKIVCVHKPEVTYTLIEGKIYEVGRKTGDINFPNDQSISRNHAEIIVEHPIANVTNASLTPNICVTDLGSKFGTFINDGIERKTPLSMREKMNLTPEDRFKFGLQWNEFRIVYTPLMTTSSAVRDIIKLRTTIAKLGAHVLPEWTDKCEFVVMEAITLTIKAVCALLSGKRIVTPAYFEQLLKWHVDAKGSLPNPSDFLPPLAEKSLKGLPVSFEPDPLRSKIFEGKVFMFATLKQSKKLSSAIESGGGMICLISSADTSELEAAKFLLMTPVIDKSTTLDQQTCKAIDTYKRSGKRVIPESEIGLATVHNCTDKHCNPLYSFTDAIFPPPRMISQTQSSSTSSNANASFQPVPETQDMVTQRSITSQSIDIIEETMIGTSTAERNRSGSASVLDISTDGENPDSSKAVHNPKKRQDDDVLPISKRRLPQSSVTFLEPSLKKPRKEPITSNKTLSKLFDSSSDEDEATEMDAATSLEPVEVDHTEADSVSVSIPSTSSRSQNNPPPICDTEEDLFPTDKSSRESSVVNKRKIEKEASIPESPAGSSKRKIEKEASIPESPAGSSKRKLEEDEAPKGRGKTRKIGQDSSNQVIQTKLKQLDISKQSVAAVPKLENGNSEENMDIKPCPTFFVKQVLIEREPPAAVANTSGKNVINYKRFKKTTPLSSSCRANSIPEDTFSIRLVLAGDENTSFSAFPKPASVGKGNTREMILTDADADQSEVFQEPSVPVAQSDPQPSTSRRATRSGSMSPPKPLPKRGAKPPTGNPAKDLTSQIDFERHVEGGPRLTRSGRGGNSSSPPKPVRKQKQSEIDDMWTFH